MNDRNKSTVRTTWNCKYHIVFAPKFRRKILYRPPLIIHFQKITCNTSRLCVTQKWLIPPVWAIFRSCNRSVLRDFLHSKQLLEVPYNQKREIVGKILRKLCEWKNVEILKAEVCPDHIHMLVAIPPKLSVSSFMGYLKGKSSLELYDVIPELKNRYRNREFWCRGYYVDTTGKDTERIKAYIQQQLEEDKLGEQMTMFGK